MAVRKKQRRGAAVVLWTLAFVAAGHLGLALVIEYARPDLRDAEYGEHVKHLRQRLREAPDRPLVVALGSSRVLNALAADDLAPGRHEARTGKPLVFNMALVGAGPTGELICLRRLLDQGIRPRAVLIEVLPQTLHPVPGDTQVLEPIPEQRRNWRHRDVLPADEQRSWLQEGITPPWFAYRYGMLRRLAPTWLPPEKLAEVLPTTGYGWLPYPYEKVSPEYYAAKLKLVRDLYAPVLDFTAINSRADRLYRAILEECREHGIVVLGLITMPESSDFRRWYKSGTIEVIDNYLARLCQDYGTRYINAREWLPDNHFADGHHLLLPGAHAFTARLWREVVQPWAEQK
jgi:hypothetical protein